MKFKFFFLLFLFVFTGRLNAQTQVFTNTDRATFIIDIAQYVTWRNSKKIDTYRLGVLDRDSLFFKELTSFASGRTIQGKPVKTVLFDSIIQINNVEIVFLNRNTGFDIDLVYQQIKGKQILLLSENYPYHKSMINFIVAGGKKRFEINQARMDAEGFKTTVTFDALAVKSELDWHKIYSETEKELYEQKGKVAQLNDSIQLQKVEIEKQEQVLKELVTEVNLQKKRLVQYMDEIELLEQETNQQKKQAFQLLSEIKKKQKVLEEKENELLLMTDKIKKKEAENIRQEQILDKQSQSIKIQKDQIDEQDKVLNKQLEKLHQQSIIINLGVTLIIMFIVLVYFIYRSYKIKKQSVKNLKEKNKIINEQKVLVEQEKEKSDALLLNILPSKVADDLKLKGFTEPEEFRAVTVFFSDFVGFTEISSKMPPKQLIDELNDLYTIFDNIMQQHHCERIKTIGDAYMAVCGMPVANNAHAYNMAEAALAILNYIKQRNLNSSIQWKLRIGLHSGRVVGGIVGTKKFIYDIFGDTINVAARMESNSLPMRINMSESTYLILKDSFSFEKREAIQVKGKGLMNMYLLDTDAMAQNMV